MSIYKTIDPNYLTTRQRTLFKSQSLTNSSSGVRFYSYESASTAGSGFVRNGVSGSKDSLYNTLLVNFYLSGSQYNDEEYKYSNPDHSAGPWQAENFNRNINPIFNRNFHSASKGGAMFSVPLQYYGELIKPGSFKLISKSAPSDIEIKDDKFGNLYVVPRDNKNHAGSTNLVKFPYPDVTGSLSASISSSTNYVGNIFYDYGIVTLNKNTFVNYGYSASLDDTVSTGINQQFSMSFSGVKKVYTSIYTVKVNPQEFNFTANPTCYEPYDTSSFQYGDRLWAPLTSSGDFTPYFNMVGLYNANNDLLMVGKYNQNIQRNFDVPLKLKLTMDW